MTNKPPQKNDDTQNGDEKPEVKEKPPEFEQETPHDPSQPEKASSALIPDHNDAVYQKRYSEDSGRSL